MISPLQGFQACILDDIHDICTGQRILPRQLFKTQMITELHLFWKSFFSDPCPKGCSANLDSIYSDIATA